MTAVYVTVEHLGTMPTAARPPCQGCSSPAAMPSSSAGRSEMVVSSEYRLVGASGTIAFCRDCAVHSIKSLAARFMMFDPSATRDLMSFFAAEAPKKRPAGRKRRTPRRLAVIDVVDATKQLAAPSEPGGRKRGR